jgi:hypothetical protein
MGCKEINFLVMLLHYVNVLPSIPETGLRGLPCCGGTAKVERRGDGVAITTKAKVRLPIRNGDGPFFSTHTLPRGLGSTYLVNWLRDPLRGKGFQSLLRPLQAAVDVFYPPGTK